MGSPPVPAVAAPPAVGLMAPRRLTFMDRWQELSGGFARIVAYDPARGAGFYLGKYVAKGGEVDLGGPWWPPSIPPCVLEPVAGLSQGQ